MLKGINNLRLGLGTAQLSNTDKSVKGVKHISEIEVKSIINDAVNKGIWFYDTGTHYGHTETFLGELKRTYQDRVFIATKIGLGADGIRNFSKDNLNAQLDSSLRRLKTDKIDLLQLNKPSLEDIKRYQLFDYLKNLKEGKRIKYAGLVVGKEEDGFYAVENKEGIIDALQIFYNLIYFKSEDLLKIANENKIFTIIRSPLNSGLLSGHYSFDQKFDKNDERKNYFSGPLFKERLTAIKKIQKKLEIMDEEMVFYSLKFILSNNNVHMVIPGASTVKQLDLYLAAARLKDKFKEDELSGIKNVISGYMSEINHKLQN